MMHELSLGSGDVIVLDLFGRVNGDVSGERSSFQAFFSVFQLLVLLLSSCTHCSRI